MSRYPQVKLADSSSVYGQCANKLFDIFIAPLMRLRTFQTAYTRALDDPAPADLWTKILLELNTTLTISDNDLARIPKTGSLIVVANHPHGIMDGPLLGSLMHRVRDDFKIIMNEATTMPGLEDSLLFVSILGSARENAKKNILVMREALEWLKAGHAIVLFPAGEISAIQNMQEKVALDNTWSTGMIRLSMRSQAPILPLFIVGQNDSIFLKLGLIHPIFRTLQIGRVTNQLCGRTMTIHASTPMPSKLLEYFNDDTTRCDFIRSKVYSLLSREPEQRRQFERLDIEQQDTRAAFDILNSHEHFKIRQNNTYTVLLFNQPQLLELNPEYTQIFEILKKEIGSLRELTFREIGEGTGQALDLDVFDEYYYHLTLWDHQQKRLVGAYRIAFTDEILPQYGIGGLYTALQFDYHPDFFTAIGPAIELSRAFVIKENQKTNLGLSTLLGALGQVLIARQNTHTFFGAVSISNEFQAISKKLMVDFLGKYHGRAELAPLVTAKNPPQLNTYMPNIEWQRLLNSTHNLSLLTAIICGIEPDDKAIPPLISAYISLMGRFVTFDFDSEFNSIDGLLVIDMQEATQHSAAIVRRLVGKESFEKYVSQT